MTPTNRKAMVRKTDEAPEEHEEVETMMTTTTNLRSARYTVTGICQYTRTSHCVSRLLHTSAQTNAKNYEVKFNRPVLHFPIFLYGNRLPRRRLNKKPSPDESIARA